MWFDDWASVGRIAVTGVVGYVALILVLRISGKRSLSKMNAFDFIITIALGSTFATMLVSDSVPVVDGVVALLLLVGLQWIVTSVYVRSERFENVVKSRPQLLYWQGEYLDDVLERERITRREVQAAMRDTNTVDHEKAVAVLENDGSVSVMTLDDGELPQALEEVRRLR